MATKTAITTTASATIVTLAEFHYDDDDDDDEGGDDTSSVTICNTTSIQQQQEPPSVTTTHACTTTIARRQLELEAIEADVDTNTSTTNINYRHEASENKENKADNCRDDDGTIIVNVQTSNEYKANTGCVANIIQNVGHHPIEAASTTAGAVKTTTCHYQPEATNVSNITSPPAPFATTHNGNLLLCRRFKDLGDTLRNYNSLPLFVYATSPSTHALSADGVGIAQVAVKAAEEAANNNKKNSSIFLPPLNITCKFSASATNSGLLRSHMDCLPLTVTGGLHHPHVMASTNTVNVTVAPTALTPGYVPHHQHNLNVDHNTHLLHHHNAGPYINSYALHHGVGSGGTNHHHIHSEQTKSLQELQHEVGALLEFRDLVIETFPDLKQKMASMSSAASTTSNLGGGSGLANGGQSVGSVISTAGSTATLTSNSTLVSRREWEPGIRIKRKVMSQKETNQSAATTELSSSSLTRSRSNSQSGKKEPKTSSGGGGGGGGNGTGGVGGGEHNNGSVIQDSGFSTETSSSKEGHSASSTNGALTGAIASNRLSCLETDDELLNLLDVIHRKSNRLREEVEHLQNYECQQFQQQQSVSNNDTDDVDVAEGGAVVISKSSSSSANAALTPKTFREHVERLNKEDIKQLRKERDRLLDKLAEMEAETLTGRIKAAKMSDQVEELINVKKELEEQLKLAMAQKLELVSRVQKLQQQQQFSKISNSQSDKSAQKCYSSSSTTTVQSGLGVMASTTTQRSKQNTFQPIVNDSQPQCDQQTPALMLYSSPENSHQQLIAFHQSISSDTKHNQQQQQFPTEQLGRLDGIVSNPGLRNSKCRLTDSKKIAAILLENNVIELQRHLLTLTVQNQVLIQKLDQANKSKSHIVKNLDKSKEDVEDLRFQLEEKNIELEGTKAQLRVLETRLQSSVTLSGMPSNNSYLLHSHHDYETNRSSNSTILMMSRREGGSCESRRSATPIRHLGQMPQPSTTQISTPSMKAMVRLPMDELQQNNSSTESAQDHDEQHEQPMPTLKYDKKDGVGGIMSIRVDGVSPLEEQQQIITLRNQVQALKKFSGVATKPSKIPLPGSKAATYFAGKPPSGRPSTAGRSPTSTNRSSSANRSPLSRSTGNLLYSKSPNSLKRADSVQSIRKDNNHNSSSLSTTCRSSISSFIPLPTTPYNCSTSKANNATTGSINCNNSPSSRVLQSSPLPKLKRESLSARLRQMDSLSRAYNNTHQHQQQQQQQNSSPNMVANNINDGESNVVSSICKTSILTTPANSTQRKDVLLCASKSFSHASTPFTRRSVNSKNNCNTTTPSAAATTLTTAARRFSSASVVGARIGAPTRQMEIDLQHNSNVSGGSSTAVTVASTSSNNFNSGSGGGGVNGNGATSDSDSGKNLTSNINGENYTSNNTKNNMFEKSGLSEYFERDLIADVKIVENKSNNEPFINGNRLTLSQYFENLLVRDSREQIVSKRYRNGMKFTQPSINDDIVDYYTSFNSYMSSSEAGSDNLLVTFDYGYSDSLDSNLSWQGGKTKMNVNNTKETAPLREEYDVQNPQRLMYIINEEESKGNENIRQNKPIFKPFKCHEAFDTDDNDYEESTKLKNLPLLSSLEACNNDTSGDYGSWQQSVKLDETCCSCNSSCNKPIIKCEKLNNEAASTKFYYNRPDYLF